MKISLITASYNSEQYIETAVKSLLNQSFTNWEHVLIDGASSDNTVEKVQQLSPNTIISSEQDKGLYDALNKGIEKASGEVIVFLHSDDVLADVTVLENVAKAFEEDASLQAVYGDLNYLDTSLTKTIRKWRSGKPKSFKTGWMPPHPALFVKKEVFQRIGAFRLDLGTAADYEWMLRAFEVNNIKAKYLPQVFINMRVGGMSNETLSARNHAFRNDLKAWKVNGFSANHIAVILKKLRKLPQYL